MSESKIRIGILGSGSMGSVHAECLRDLPGVEVTGVFSRNRDHAAAAARICGAKATTDPMELIDSPSVDAVDVCVPSLHHRQFVIAALEKGKHVFCETPFALSIEEGRTMIDAAHQSNHILMVGLLMRSIAHYEHVHRVVASAEQGKLLSVTTYRLGSYLRPNAPDHKSHYSEPSTELMTFDFDFVQWLMGPPARISATAVQQANG